MLTGNRNPLLIYLPLALLFFGSCGLEDYPYIYPVPQSSITQEMNYRATVRIPSNNSSTTFTHFVIFYRIYVSDVLDASTTRDSYTAINPLLASDYNAILPYIDSDTLVNTNMDTLFSNRNYKYLYLENYNIDSELDSSVLGSTLIFDFSSSKVPTVTIGGTEFVLWRSNGNGAYTPHPHRYFINSSDLYRSDYINENTNADVVNKSGITAADPHYTYAAMFIAAVGIDVGSYSYIYSTPSLIHVFLLPDQW